ncbi:hypothetical protein [Endozoicomonas atrinae]|uniref:hypothetical protein n=1 Tax=Endozoicomonas atrinae TaxID=1333660 RepID=UPI00082530F0|nr:hypothetical protein [Endozoicomonas atrinae]
MISGWEIRRKDVGLFGAYIGPPSFEIYSDSYGQFSVAGDKEPKLVAYKNFKPFPLGILSEPVLISGDYNLWSIIKKDKSEIYQEIVYAYPNPFKPKIQYYIAPVLGLLFIILYITRNSDISVRWKTALEKDSAIGYRSFFDWSSLNFVRRFHTKKYRKIASEKIRISRGKALRKLYTFIYAFQRNGHTPDLLNIINEIQLNGFNSANLIVKYSDELHKDLTSEDIINNIDKLCNYGLKDYLNNVGGNPKVVDSVIYDSNGSMEIFKLSYFKKMEEYLESLNKTCSNSEDKPEGIEKAPDSIRFNLPERSFCESFVKNQLTTNISKIISLFAGDDILTLSEENDSEKATIEIDFCFLVPNFELIYPILEQITFGTTKYGFSRIFNFNIDGEEVNSGQDHVYFDPCLLFKIKAALPNETESYTKYTFTNAPPDYISLSFKENSDHSKKNISEIAFKQYGAQCINQYISILLGSNFGLSQTTNDYDKDKSKELENAFSELIETIESSASEALTEELILSSVENIYSSNREAIDLFVTDLINNYSDSTIARFFIEDDLDILPDAVQQIIQSAQEYTNE